MKSLFASADFGMVGLVLFFTLFLGVLVWLFWPGKTQKFKEHGTIPLKDDNYE